MEVINQQPAHVRAVLRQDVWERRNDARLWARYFFAVGVYHRRADITFSIVIALAGSGALATGAKETALLLPAWQLLTGFAVILSVVRPILLNGETTRKLAEASGRWTERAVEWDKLWLSCRLEEEVPTAVITEAMEKDSKVDEATQDLPDWRWLVKKCQGELKRAEGV